MNKTTSATQSIQINQTTLHFSLLTLLTSIKQTRIDCKAAYKLELFRLGSSYMNKLKLLRHALKIITYALHRRLFIAGITQVPFTYQPHITKADILVAISYARRTY